MDGFLDGFMDGFMDGFRVGKQSRSTLASYSINSFIFSFTRVDCCPFKKVDVSKNQ